ncbi:MAG: archaeoflavoprotein AfpA [Theionarchaea archaeon]|nr:archaeoflavoprotein AfpA [Theionarchaea archaeon]MBU7038858.1 archaeoflavoprotein AfpA [Theionarchaea archaeon]
MEKLAWGITGSGDYMRESLDMMKDIRETCDVRIDVFLSREGELVLNYYKYMQEVRRSFENVHMEKGPNIPFLSGKLQMGKYRLFMICPATANTVAKLAHGIADSLITNSAAQAMKVSCPVYIYPVDQTLGDIVTTLPDGSEMTLHVREVDVKNVEILEKMEGITVVKHVEDIEEIIRAWCSR